MQKPVETTRATSSVASTHAGGFSLIEVMIVIAIVGILAAIAYPSYGQYVMETRRADGHLGLLEASQSMERCKSTSYSYANCVLPRTTSSEGYYDLTLEQTATTFTLTATGIGPQVHDTDCATITLNHLSVKGPKVGTDPSICWK